LAGSKAWTAMVFDKERREKKHSHAPPLAQPKPSENGNSQQQQMRPQSHEGSGSKSMPTSPTKGRARPQSDAQFMSGALKAHSRTQSDAPLTQAGPAKGHSRTQSDAPPAQSSPTKGHARHRSEIPPPIEKDPKHKGGVMPRKREVGEATRRDQVRSMMF
jgi:hypothetical protein